MGEILSEVMVSMAPSPEAPTIEVAVQRYLAQLRRRGRSPDTVAAYGYWLERLRQHLQADAGVDQVADLERSHFEAWQDSLLGLRPKSRSLVATATRGWLKWLADRDLVDWRLLRGVEAVSAPRGRPRPIPLEDLERLKTHLERSRTLRELRDRALFNYLLTTGGRVSEALRVRRDEYRTPIVVQKGGREKQLVAPDNVLEMVRQYLAMRDDELPQVWIATSPPLRPLRPASVRAIWRQLAREAGVRPWTTHQFRHTCGTEMARAGVPPQVIADHLGHANLDMVLIYVKIVEEQEAAKLEVLKKIAGGSQTGVGWVRLRGRVDRRHPEGRSGRS
jgi:site-specific recombinase XerD